MKDQVTVFVSTDDRYNAAWPPLCHSLKKFWSDCPWPIRFVTNHLDPPCGKALKTGSNMDWTLMQRRALEQIQTDIILFLIGDHWLTETVDTKALVDFAEIIACGRADRIMLIAGGRHESKGTFEADPRLNVYADKSPYRTALQAGLWRVETFLSLLKEPEDAWDFETRGSLRSQDSQDVFLHVKEHRYMRYVERCLPEYSHSAVRRGEWTESARKYAAIENLQIDFSIHPKDNQ